VLWTIVKQTSAQDHLTLLNGSQAVARTTAASPATSILQTCSAKKIFKPGPEKGASGTSFRV